MHDRLAVRGNWACEAGQIGSGRNPPNNEPALRGMTRVAVGAFSAMVGG